ncbi:hypothetical protein [Saliphagus infecundisoli]|uniref:DUF2238 domain-containing protein n=1 Tax=Saliphagus infecundisoli TaxID=1849069 RepID=A0ABD5QBR2_9EURY|nr:hypothetical protein [Saliphagus infecundisoli]
MHDGRFDGTGANALLGWLAVAVLAGLAIREGLAGSYRWFSLTAAAIVPVVLPAATLRDPRAMPPWELIALVAVPVADAALLGETLLSPVATYLAVAAVALIVAVDLHTFTAVRMTRAFALALVVIATLAVAATWNVAQWVSDTALGTDYLVSDRSGDAANHAMMIDFLYATLAGLLAGVVLAGYLRWRSFAPTAAGVPRSAPEEVPEPTPSFSRERFALPDERLAQCSWAMQLALGVLLVYGLLARDVTTITNAAIALSVTALPAVLERNYRLPIEPELVVWLTAAAFLHVLGSAGLYDLLGQWDTLTHTLSASLVAATGYTVVRTVDLHSEEVYLPSRTMFAFILLFVLAVGVVWELAEFGVDFLAQRFVGGDAVLAQHGIDDTVTDLLFNLVGAVVAATLGASYLTETSARLAGRIGGRTGD